MLFGIVTYAMQRGKRDFTSTSQVVATNYDVVVSFEAAGEARRLLHQLPMTPHDASGGARRRLPRSSDYQPSGTQQPGPQQPGQQGQAPQRPAGWNDPYGQRAAPATGRTAAPAAGQDPRPSRCSESGAPAHGAPGTAAVRRRRRPSRSRRPQEPGAAARAGQRPRRVRYPDLPDGRPQYGVRVRTPKPAPGQDGRSTERQAAAHRRSKGSGPEPDAPFSCRCLFAAAAGRATPSGRPTSW